MARRSGGPRGLAKMQQASTNKPEAAEARRESGTWPLVAARGTPRVQVSYMWRECQLAEVSAKLQPRGERVEEAKKTGIKHWKNDSADGEAEEEARRENDDGAKILEPRGYFAGTMCDGCRTILWSKVTINKKFIFRMVWQDSAIFR